MLSDARSWKSDLGGTIFHLKYVVVLTQTSKIGSLVEVQESEDPEGLRVMYYLIQDLKVG